jgi:hypothetical protein
MEVKEERNEAEYKAIPLKTRILIRLIVILLRYLQPKLEKHQMSAYFAIESYADLLEDQLEDADEPKLQ